LSSAGCTSPATSTVSLDFWAMGREGEVVEQLMPEFERANPGIHVRVQQLPFQGAHEKLLTAFVGEVTPDVAQMGNTWLPEFAALRALKALGPSVAASREIDTHDYFEGIWDTNVVDGELYGVPWYVDTRLLFYRRDLLAQAGFSAPPSSWALWTEMMLAIKRLVGPDRYAVFLPLNEVEPLVALALQQPEPLLRDGGRFGNFRSAGFRRTLRFYLDLFRRQLAPPATNSQVTNVWNEFARGYYSFYITGPWNIGEFKRRLPPDLQQSWMTAPLPGPDGPGKSIAGGSSLIVFKAARHPAEAWKLVEYLSQPAVQARFYALTGDLPSRRSTWTQAHLDDDVHARAFRDQLERVVATPKVPEWERIATEMKTVAELMVRGNLTVEEAAATLDERADRILEKRRWMLARERGR
jgi:multiple sugar transport system substrate-binding protein